MQALRPSYSRLIGPSSTLILAPRNPIFEVISITSAQSVSRHTKAHLLGASCPLIRPTAKTAMLTCGLSFSVFNIHSSTVTMRMKTEVPHPDSTLHCRVYPHITERTERRISTMKPARFGCNQRYPHPAPAMAQPLSFVEQRIRTLKLHSSKGLSKRSRNGVLA